jgi:DNA-binding response OmpR family regulator
MPEPPLVIAADADPAVNRLLGDTLTRAGYAVRHLDGPWAVTAAPGPGVGLIVVGGSGRGATAAGVARRLRLGGDRTPVLILTNGADLDAAALAVAGPAVRTLHKPFRPAELADAAGGLLGGA